MHVRQSLGQHHSSIGQGLSVARPLASMLTAVVWGGEQGDQLPLGEELVAVLHHLVRAGDEVKVVLEEELLDDAGTKGEGDATVVFAPGRRVLVGVRPQKVAQQARVRDIGGPLNGGNLLKEMSSTGCNGPMVGSASAQLTVQSPLRLHPRLRLRLRLTAA